MKREIREYKNNGYEVFEDGKPVFRKFSNWVWNVRTYDDRGNLIIEHWNGGDKYEYTYNENGDILTETLNGELVEWKAIKDISNLLGYEV